VDEDRDREVLLQALLRQEGEDGVELLVHIAQILEQPVGQGGLGRLGKLGAACGLGMEQGSETAGGQNPQVALQGRVDARKTALRNAHATSFTRCWYRPS
jgi:hypothetical protein